MKTAMQELIEFVSFMQKNGLAYSVEIESVSTDFLAREKKQIADAWKNGGSTEFVYSNSEAYFNDKYGEATIESNVENYIKDHFNESKELT